MQTNLKNTLSVLLLTSAFGIIAISSCKKETDSEKPVISIEEPMANDTISLTESDSIHVEFTASDNEELHEVNVSVTNASGQSVFSSNEDVDKPVYSYHEHFVPSGITGITQFTLRVDASDHSGNEESKTLTFFVTP
jgi:hypothetical protein